MHIFIDESGTLPDPKDKFIVISGVGVKKIKEAKNLINRIMASLCQRKIRIKELKFYYAGQQTKRQFLSSIVSVDFEIFVLIIDKKDRKISDTPENFAILIANLVNEINLWYKTERFIITIDKHFHRRIDQVNFNEFFKKQLDNKLEYSIRHVNSQQNHLVNIADMVAGAVFQKYIGKNLQFYNLIKDNIIIEKLISWPQVKKRSLNKKFT